MASLNTVTLIGRLGKDPEARYFESGSMVCTFTLAVDGWNREGKEPESHWFDVKVWGKTAQTAADWLKKGSHQVGLSGRLEQERWQTQAGEKRSRIVVVAERLQLLGRPGQGQQGGQQQPAPAQRPAPAWQGQDQGFGDEEIPF